LTTGHHPLRGILMMLGAVLCFALLDATAKHLAQKFPVPMLVWARYTLHFLLMLIFLAPSMGWRLVRTSRPAKQIVRALMLVGVTGFNIAALRFLPLAETTALLFVTPLVVALLAGPFLGEKLTAALGHQSRRLRRCPADRPSRRRQQPDRSGFRTRRRSLLQHLSDSNPPTLANGKHPCHAFLYRLGRYRKHDTGRATVLGRALAKSS
jgi:hypothetical protein